MSWMRKGGSPNASAAARGEAVSPISPEDRQRELEVLLRSGIVRERTQLYSLLSYLGRLALDGHDEPLKEYTVGVEALHKPADYDPRLDPTVRVEVGKLRKKLQEYYRGAGAVHAVKLEIPKGGYLPVYQRDARTGEGRRRRWLPAALLAAAALCLAGLGVSVALRRGPAGRLSPELQAFWAPHLAGSVPTILVFGTPLFLKVDGSFYRDPRANSAQALEASQDLRRLLDALRPGETRPVFKFTGVGEAEALFLLTRLLASQHVPLTVQGSGTLTWEDLKGKHVILLGGRKYNPLIPELPYRPKFQAVSEGIANLHPQGREPGEYHTERSGTHGEVLVEYALVSVYPGLTPATRLLTLDCSSTEGTLAAAEFVTRPDTLHELIVRKLPLAPERNAIRPFQVVVGARFNRGVPLRIFYVAHAVLP